MTVEELERLLQKKGLSNHFIRNSDYWRERFEILENATNNKGVEYMQNSSKIYQKAINETEKEISKWYTRYANAEGISYQEAQKQLNANELKEFKMSVEEYIEKGKTLGVSQKWAKELERASTKVHISRLEMLKLQMQQRAEIVTAQKSTGIKDLMKDIYSDSFYKTAYELQKGVGVASNFAKLDKKTIEKVLSKPWAADGSNFSDRVWGSHRAQLVSKLHEDLSLNIIQGKSAKDLIKKISNEFEVDRKRTATLVYTEKAYFHSLAQLDSFKELGVEEFEIVATLDSKTSEICMEMDGKHFKLKDFLVGITAPPFHPRCRTVTCPYFDDEFTIDEERAARDSEGKYYTVPSNMTYKDWKRNFVNQTVDNLKHNQSLLDLESDKFIKKMKDKVKSFIVQDKVVNFGELPIDLQNNFIEQLQNSDVYVKTLLEDIYKDTSYLFDLSYSNSSHIRRLSIVCLNTKDSSTIAHELFHVIDAKYNITNNSLLSAKLDDDYKKLLQLSKGDIVTYLAKEFPHAFTSSSNYTKMKKEYRGISDILNGLSYGEIKLGFSHRDSYWKNDSTKCIKEAWAQYGRIGFEANQEVIDMLMSIFPNFTNESVRLSKRIGGFK